MGGRAPPLHSPPLFLFFLYHPSSSSMHDHLLPFLLLLLLLLLRRRRLLPHTVSMGSDVFHSTGCCFDPKPFYYIGPMLYLLWYFQLCSMKSHKLQTIPYYIKPYGQMGFCLLGFGLDTKPKIFSILELCMLRTTQSCSIQT